MRRGRRGGAVVTARVVLGRASRSRWLARRRRGITATDVPALLGLSLWRTPLGVWLDKVQPVEREASYAMRRGLALEETMAAEYARQTGAIVEKPPLLLGHPEHPVLLASVDRLAHDRAGTRVLELKTASDWREWADGAVPDVYAVQVLAQLAVTGCEEGVIFADVAGRLETRTIPRSREWEAETVPRLVAWWEEHVEGRVPPPLDPYRDYPLLNRVWAPDPAEETYADDAVLGALEALVKLRERTQELTNIQTGLKCQVRAHMGTAAVLRHPETGEKVARVDKRGALLVTYKREASA